MPAGQSSSAVETKTEKPKQAPKKKAAAKAVGDPNDPFTQSWNDNAPADAQGAENIFMAKKYLPHTYVTVKVDCSQIEELLPGTPLEHFLRLAAKKAYGKVIDHDKAMFAKSLDDLGVRVSQVEDSTEALPIAIETDKICVHFTSVKPEVVTKLSGLGVFEPDNEECDGSETIKSLKAADLKLVNISKISVVFDVNKVDELSGVMFAKEIQFMMNDPDMLLL